MPEQQQKQPTLTHCTFCNLEINFWAKFSSDSDHNNRALAPEAFSALFVNSTTFCTFALTDVSAFAVKST
jgi:hypothetical protein